MEEQIIFIYCLADAIANSLNFKDEYRAKMTNAEIITFVMISALFFQCNYKFTRLISIQGNLFSSPLSQSRMSRRIHQIPEEVWLLMFTICRHINFTCKEFIVDSFPVAFCQNHKRFRCKLFPGKKFHGYTASKKQYFFGIKVHMIVNTDGIPIEFVFTPGSESDIRGLHRLNIDLPKGSMLFSDRAYNEYSMEDFLENECEIRFIPKRRKNLIRQHQPYEELKLSLTRNKIETVFSSITALMPRWIRARTEKGFCLKIIFFILAYTIKVSFL